MVDTAMPAECQSRRNRPPFAGAKQFHRTTDQPEVERPSLPAWPLLPLRSLPGTIAFAVSRIARFVATPARGLLTFLVGAALRTFTLMLFVLSLVLTPPLVLGVAVGTTR